MTDHEKQLSNEERKRKIRERYKGVDRDALELIPAREIVSFNEDTSFKRVAAYCRVSTDDPNQTSSYELQKNHYEEYIKEHLSDRFVVAEDLQEIYEDEDGYPDYDVDYSYFNTEAIDDITEENGFAEIECQYGAGRDG